MESKDVSLVQNIPNDIESEKKQEQKKLDPKLKIINHDILKQTEAKFSNQEPKKHELSKNKPNFRPKINRCRNKESFNKKPEMNAKRDRVF